MIAHESNDKLLVLYDEKYLLKLKEEIELKYGVFDEIKLIENRILLLKKIRDISPYIKSEMNNYSNYKLEFENIGKCQGFLREFLEIPIQTICVIIICFNEERCIQRCIESILNVVDEIVVVDTGSTDKTVQIIKSFNSKKIKFYHYEWSDSFAAARNYALEQVTSSWVFYIDADEYLEIDDPNELKSIINLFYHFPLKDSLVLSPSITNHNEHNLLNVSRIFLKESNIKYFGLVHEGPRKDIKQMGNDVYNIALDIKLAHDGYLEHILEEKNKMSRNMLLLNKMIEIEPENPRWKYFLVRDGLNILDPDKIETIILDTILIDPKGDISSNCLKNHEFTFALLNILTELSLNSGNFKRVEELAELLNELDPNNSNSFYFSMISKYLGYKKEMYSMLQKTIQYRENSNEVQHGMLHSNGYHIDYLLAILLFEAGMYDKSFKYLDFLVDKYINEDYLLPFQSLIKAIKDT